jgi:hypothetical protein
MFAFYYLIKVFHESHYFSVSEPESFVLAEDHDFSERDGAAVVSVNLVKEFLKSNLPLIFLKSLMKKCK